MSTRYGRPPEPPTYQPPRTVQAGQPQTVQFQSQESGTNETVDLINEKLQSGTRLSIRETAFMAKYYPEQASRYASAIRLNQKLGSGQNLNIKEIAYLAKNYPELLQTHEVIRGEQQHGFPNLKTLSSAAREHPEMFQQQRHSEMYQRDVVNRPKNAWVARPVPEEAPPQKSLSQLMSEYRTTPLVQRMSLNPLERGPQQTKPLAGLGGLIAPFETVGYTATKLVGVKTPSYPPLPNLENPEYTAGYFVGEGLMLMASSMIAGKVAEGIGKVGHFVGEKTGLTQKVKMSDTYNILKENQAAVEKNLGTMQPSLVSRGKAFVGSVDSWLARNSASYRKWAERNISSGYVDVPDIGMTAPRTMSEKVLGLPELDSPYTLGMGGMEAERGALSFGTTARTALLDPNVTSPLETGITREIFERGLPRLPNASFGRQSNLMAKALGSATVLGLQGGASLPSMKQEAAKLVQEPKLVPVERLTPGSPFTGFEGFNFGMRLEEKPKLGMDVSGAVASYLGVGTGSRLATASEQRTIRLERSDMLQEQESGMAMSSVVANLLGSEMTQGLVSEQMLGQVQQLRTIQTQRQVQIHGPRQIQVQRGQLPQGRPFDSEGMMRKLLGEKPSRVKRVRVGRYERDWVHWTPQQMLKRMVGNGHVRK